MAAFVLHRMAKKTPKIFTFLLFAKKFVYPWSKTVLIIAIWLHIYIVSSPVVFTFIDARKEPWIVDLCKVT